MERQIREVRRVIVGRAQGALRDEDERSAGEAVRPAVYAHLSRTRHTHEEYVYFVVHVLPDTFACGEPDEVNVEIAALPEAPDNVCTPLGGG